MIASSARWMRRDIALCARATIRFMWVAALRDRTEAMAALPRTSHLLDRRNCRSRRAMHGAGRAHACAEPLSGDGVIPAAQRALQQSKPGVGLGIGLHARDAGHRQRDQDSDEESGHGAADDD